MSCGAYDDGCRAFYVFLIGGVWVVFYTIYLTIKGKTKKKKHPKK